VAQCRLPFSFNILSKLPPGQRALAIHGTKKRPRPEEEDGDPPAPEPRAVRRRRRQMDDVNALALGHPPGNGQGHHPAPYIGNHGSPQGREDSSSSSLPLVPLLQPAGSADLSSVRPQVIPPPKPDRECTPTLTEVNPDSGTITGGLRVWLKGMNFPVLLPLFARFGAAVVPTVCTCFRLSRSTSFCLLDIFFFQPSCLSFTSQNQPRRHQCYAFEASPIKCAGVWNQHRDIQI
jgi:hypothetical protein